MDKIDNRKTHTSIVRRKRPDGTYYVQRITSVYNPKIQNNSVIKSETLGILPAGETDLSKLEPITKKKKKAASTVRDVNTGLLDPRVPYLIQYPLDLVLLVIVLSNLAGYSSDYQVAQYWKANRKIFERWFEDFPHQDISHDTVRRLVKVLGRNNAKDLIERFTRPLLEQYSTRVVAIDGQAVRAAITSKQSRYVLNVYDAENEVCLQQKLIGEKNNEITEAVNVLEGLDLTGAVITCDALNTQTKLARAVIEDKHADYCFALKENQDHLYKEVQGWFKTRKRFEAKCSIEENIGHGRQEKREIAVLPAQLLQKLNAELLGKWAGLEDGCIVQAKTKRSLDTGAESEDVRYYITSLNYDKRYIAQVLARIIRRHWSIENNLHWVLDVVFRQDEMQCRNSDYLTGRTLINKVVLNLMSKLQIAEEKTTGKASVSKPAMKAMLSAPEQTIALLTGLYRKNL